MSAKIPLWAVRLLHPPFVHLGVNAVIPHCVGPQTRLRTKAYVGSDNITEYDRVLE